MVENGDYNGFLCSLRFMLTDLFYRFYANFIMYLEAHEDLVKHALEQRVVNLFFFFFSLFSH